MFSCELCKILKNTYFAELFRMAASVPHLKSGAAIYRYSGRSKEGGAGDKFLYSKKSIGG